jgi:hypothetical protein
MRKEEIMSEDFHGCSSCQKEAEERKAEIIKKACRNDPSQLVEVSAEKRKEFGLQVTPNDVAQVFQRFLGVYDAFRDDNGLSHSIGDVKEVCNAMTDKHSRIVSELMNFMSINHGLICRHVKHMEREDPKDTWPDEVTEAMAGYLIYMRMILDYYPEMNIVQGFQDELQKAIDQHGRKKCDFDNPTCDFDNLINIVEKAIVEGCTRITWRKDEKRFEVLFHGPSFPEHDPDKYLDLLGEVPLPFIEARGIIRRIMGLAGIEVGTKKDLGNKDINGVIHLEVSGKHYKAHTRWTKKNNVEFIIMEIE